MYVTRKIGCLLGKTYGKSHKSCRSHPLYLPICEWTCCSEAQSHFEVHMGSPKSNVELAV